MNLIEEAHAAYVKHVGQLTIDYFADAINLPASSLVHQKEVATIKGFYAGFKAARETKKVKVDSDESFASNRLKSWRT